jgi:hypothetical protein
LFTVVFPIKLLSSFSNLRNRAKNLKLRNSILYPPEQVNFQLDDEEVRLFLDQHAELDFL